MRICDIINTIIRDRENEQNHNSLFIMLGRNACVRINMAGTSRRSMTSQMVMSAPRATASTKQISATAAVNNAAPVEKSSVRVEEVEASVTAKDMREKEKAACINNNIGIGNTFVWASRYSNTNNYASMVEDVENPENNICFVKVELKSSDSKISVADVPSQYFEMGRDITCGAWADEGVLRQRILDAKKTARTWGTVGGAVGGAGVGVGMMELFGNKLIGGKVEGQKDKNLSEAEAYAFRIVGYEEGRKKSL